MAAMNSLTDRATLIAAGLLANPHLVELRDVSDPDTIAAHAVRIAHAVKRAAKANPSAALPKPPKAPKGKKSKQEKLTED